MKSNDKDAHLSSETHENGLIYLRNLHYSEGGYSQTACRCI